MKLIRLEAGHYRTEDGLYETWKADDGVRTHGGPVWLLWRMTGKKREAIGSAGSLIEARKKFAALTAAPRT